MNQDLTAAAWGSAPTPAGAARLPRPLTCGAGLEYQVSTAKGANAGAETAFVGSGRGVAIGEAGPAAGGIR